MTLWLKNTEPTNGVPKWGVAQQDVESAELILISQDCDINAKPGTEPRVEALAARWSTDPAEISMAKKGNSSRLYLLKEDGSKALLADARQKVLIAKESLLAAGFTQVFSTEPERLRFARWVAARYDRPAIPDRVVDAVNKPIVKSLVPVFRKKANSALKTVLDQVEEIRFNAQEDGGRFVIDFLIILDDGKALSVEDEAVLSAWLDETLVTDTSPVTEIRPYFFTFGTISVSDYVASTQLVLDQYSPEELSLAGDAEHAPAHRAQ